MTIWAGKTGKEIRETAQSVVETYAGAGLMLATAESCTGGMVAAAITDIPGSSAVLDRGFVTYSNQAKIEMLGVSVETLAAHGAVSQQTAIEMALGAVNRSRADVGVAITGIAGPGGGTAEKPVGLVHVAFFGKGGRPLDLLEMNYSPGATRDVIRLETVRIVLRGLLKPTVFDCVVEKQP